MADKIKTLDFEYIPLRLFLERQKCFEFAVSGNRRAVNVSTVHVLLKGR